MRICPLCGSRRVRRRIVSVKLDKGTVPGVQADCCGACGEMFFDPEALKVIFPRRTKLSRKS